MSDLLFRNRFQNSGSKQPVLECENWSQIGKYARNPYQWRDSRHFLEKSQHIFTRLLSWNRLHIWL